MDLNIASAFMVGLMGTAHCVGMCGGLLTAFASQTPPAKGNVLLHQLKYGLSYHLAELPVIPCWCDNWRFSTIINHIIQH